MNFFRVILLWVFCAFAVPGLVGWPEVVAEFSNPGSGPTVTYVHGSHGLISQRRGAVNGVGGVVRYYHGDGQGNIRMLTSGGAVTDTYDYDAYGNLTSPSGITVNNYRYTGQQWDPYLGMYYLRARYYNPTYGRFWSMDTYEGSANSPSSLHRYLYCSADPVNRADFSGNWENAISIQSTSLIVGDLAALAVSSVVEAKTHALRSLCYAALTSSVTISVPMADSDAKPRPKSRAEVEARVEELVLVDKVSGKDTLLHGTSTGFDTSLFTFGGFDVRGGGGQLGAGFYTTKFPGGLANTAWYAYNGGGDPAILVFSVDLSKLDVKTANKLNYANYWQADVLEGDLTTPWGPSSQFKFQSAKAGRELMQGFRAIVPIPKA